MKRHIKLAVLAALLALLPYTIGWHHPFVFDDHAVIEENAFLREPAAWGITLTGQTLLDKRIPDSGRPIVILSYLLDRAVWGNKPMGYRLTNMIWHAAVVCLVYALVWHLMASYRQAFSTALLWGLHPLLLEAVHSPAFREDVLVTAGLLGSLLSTDHAVRAILLLTFGLGVKESGVMAIPLFLWFWLCFPNRRPSVSVRSWILGIGGLVTGAFLLAWAASDTFQALSTDKSQIPLPIPVNIWTAPWLFLRLLRFMIWPHPLRAEHVLIPVNEWTDPRFLLGMFVVAFWVVLAWTLRTRVPHLTFAMGWILLGFIPVSNLIPLYNPFAERYAYLPSVGFAMIVAWGISHIRWAQVRAVILGMLAGLYAMGIIVPMRAWRNDFSLWQRVLAYDPASARGWTWTGIELKRRGLREEALKHFRRALELNPNESTALVNLGIMLGEDGNLAEAETVLREAVTRRPDKAETWWNLAVCLHLQGREEEALQAARRANECNPYFLPARHLFAPTSSAIEQPP